MSLRSPDWLQSARFDLDQRDSTAKPQINIGPGYPARRLPRRYAMLQMPEHRQKRFGRVMEGIDPAEHQEILLREMQHRVANTLQIVASILSLKARTVNSDDARLHLLDAYSRVMAVAAVQRQLLDSKQPDMIGIGDYLSELGQTLAKSLTQQVSISVIVDTNVAIASSKAVAMGLIVTELAINALRHAFPRQRRGK